MKTKKRPELRPLIVPAIDAIRTACYHLEAERHRLMVEAQGYERVGDDLGAAANRAVAGDYRQVAQMLADQIALRTPI